MLREQLALYGTLCQFSELVRGVRLRMAQLGKRAEMNEISAWIQTNWQELSTFLVEVGFLIAGVWFAHNILKTMRAFQEQIGALLKLTITPNADRESSAASVRSHLGESSPYWLTPSEAQPSSDGEAATLNQTVANGPGWVARTWHGMVCWMKEPMVSAHAHLGAWHRFMHWLRTPAGS